MNTPKTARRTASPPRPAPVPGQVEGISFVVVEVLAGTVERVELVATRGLAVSAAYRIARLWAGPSAAGPWTVERLEEESRYDFGPNSVQIVRVAHVGRTVPPVAATSRKGGAR